MVVMENSGVHGSSNAAAAAAALAADSMAVAQHRAWYDAAALQQQHHQQQQQQQHCGSSVDPSAEIADAYFKGQNAASYFGYPASMSQGKK